MVRRAVALAAGPLAAVASFALDVPLRVKECAGVGAQGYPVSVVVPLPRGLLADTAGLGLAGTPTQAEAIERWPQDGSLRHVLVHFPATVAAGGDVVVHLRDGGATPPPRPVDVVEDGAGVTVTTGPVRFVVRRRPFTIVDEAWLDADGDGSFAPAERIVQPAADGGAVLVPRAGAGGAQLDAARADVVLTVEERGPLRAVIRAEAPTHFRSTTDHVHGFAVRITAWAGLPYVKIDYQLRNSDHEVVRSWPLYLEELRLAVPVVLSGGQDVAFGANGTLVTLPPGAPGRFEQVMHDRFVIRDMATGAVRTEVGPLPAGEGPEGLLDVSDAHHGIAAMVRNAWQTWPNGLALDAAGRLQIELFPSWSAQWHEGRLSPSGLYWVEDMQHVVKEVLLAFHGPRPAAAELLALARTFQYPPVVVVPTDWYRTTRATLDLGGVVPPAADIPAGSDRRLPTWGTPGWDPADWYDATGPAYGAGWNMFGEPEPGYRSASCQHGGWPYAVDGIVAGGDPAELYRAEAWALGEINLRPESLPGYRHAADWDRVRPSENGYCNGRWRIHEGNGVSKLAAPPLPDTGGESPVNYARDDQHGWFYHVADGYFLTGNPWIRDWYRFVAEFRRVRLERLDPFPDTSSRAIGHTLAHAVQAFRVTGDRTLLTAIGAYIRESLRPDQDPRYGDQRVEVEPGGGGFQTGYLMRAVVDYLEEVRGTDPQAYAEGFAYLAGLVEWNRNHGSFSYYFDARAGGQGVSSGTGLTLVDGQAWFYAHTGNRAYLDQLDAYLGGGINGGERPYGDFASWSGQWEGRAWLHVTHVPREDATPPPAVTDLRAVRTGGSVSLSWTAPAGAERTQVVWSSRPITEASSTDPAVTNWWAAEQVGPAPGSPPDLVLEVGDAAAVYAALFTFDAADNMSAMSNLAEARPASPRPVRRRLARAP